MDSQSFSLIIEIPKTPQAVFAHLKEVSSWWSKDFSGRSGDLHDEFVIPAIYT